MPSEAPNPVPDNAILQWVINNPEQVQEAIRCLNLLVSMKVVLVPGTGITSSKGEILTSPEGYLLKVPVIFPSPVANSSGASVAEVAGVLNALLGQLRLTGINPG